MPETNTLPPRADIPLEETWDTYSVYPSDEAWEAACLEIEEQLPTLATYQGRLGEGPDILLEWFGLSEGCVQEMKKVRVYAFSFVAVDTTNQEAIARVDRALGLFGKLNTILSFGMPEMMAVGFDTLEAWMAAEPQLAVYRHYFRQLKDLQAYIRSPEVEAVIALSNDPFSTSRATAGMLTNADLKFAPAVDSEGQSHEVAQGTFRRLLNSVDRTLRQSTWESFADGHLAFKNTLANSLATAIKQDVFTVRARGYNSSLEASLAPNQIPTEVFHNLIQVFKSHLPTWHRYWDAKRALLGYEKFHPWDVFAPLAKNPPSIPFLQAAEWISAGMAPLGEDYVQAMRQGMLEDRWIDWRPNQGKRAGAFSMGTYGTHPFILMSYTGNIMDFSTLTHELGHSMHSYLSQRAQPYIYSDYSLFVAEVASNFNQALVRAHLFDAESDPDFHLALIEETMSNFYRYFFIMPSLARFELETHERAERGEPLTAEIMNNLMADYLAEGFGPDVEIDRPRLGSTWAQFGHLYANFYVYQYATGISAATALAQGVYEKRPGAVENYLAFLKAGSSLYPLDAVKLAGVDLTTPEPVEAAFGVLDQIVARLEKLIA
jgi:oligoendopeptidase F